MTDSTENAPDDLRIDFCGEVYEVGADESIFTVGREGDLIIDSNPFLHRQFLELRKMDHLWWLINVGTQLSVTVADENGMMHAWLAPGAQLPLVFEQVTVRFTAGPTTYELGLTLRAATFHTARVIQEAVDVTTTIGLTMLTPDQLRVVLALSEPTLRRSGNSTSEIPTSAEAALRLGWTLTKFNRKLDAICEKLGRQGVRGLHGRIDQLATNRRARLVEFAMSTRLVSKQDLKLLDS